MRIQFAILAGTLALGACGGGTEEAAKPVETGDDGKTLVAGEYAVSSEITKLYDPGNRSGLKMGDTAELSVCIGDDGKLPTDMFTPKAGDTCEPESEFVRSGRVASNYRCTRGSQGSLYVAVDGNIVDGALEADTNVSTSFGGGADYMITRRIKATRTGDCPAAEGGDVAVEEAEG